MHVLGRHFTTFILFTIFTLPAVAATNYVASPALTKVVKSHIGNVRSGQVTVPLITWGADIRTIYANGNSHSTTRDSIFGKAGLNYRLVREDIFANQLKSYMAGKTPYLRGTLGMINMAAELLNKDSRTKPVVIYQLSESAGGDALVVKSGVKRTKDLKGKTIALQAYGPHVDYLAQVLSDAGLSISDVKLKWLPDLTGTDNSPMAALHDSSVDAAMVIIPDALALTSGGNIGNGSEDSVRGAKILLSTKTANRVIADVYAVRSDYFKQNRAEVQKFVQGLFKAQEKVSELTKSNKSSTEYRNMMRASAKLLLDSEQAVSDTEGLYADAEHVSFQYNKKFFTNKNYPRNFEKRNKSIQSAFKKIRLLGNRAQLTHANWDYNSLRKGLTQTAKVEAPRFDAGKVASVVSRRQQQGRLDEGTLISFEVFFAPNQKSFSSDLYEKEFKRVIELASTYGGAIITVEGHSDPLGYLKNKKSGASSIVLRQVKQSAKNLSYTRASAVRDSIINFAKRRKVALDSSQFALVGHGVNSPRNGICGGEPCAPKNEKEWRDNMRVEFKLIQIEAEAQVFKPL